jgi:DNA repair protein RadC
MRVIAALELGRRYASPSATDAPHIQGPSDAAHILIPTMATLEQEHLRVMLLNTKNRVLAVHEVYKGSVSASLVRVGEVFREAIRRNAPAIIVAHNHPSGDPSPSPEDIHVTRRLAEAGRLLDIELLDHLIIGDGRWVSLRERGVSFGA